MNKPMKEILTEKQFEIFSDAYRRDYKRAQEWLRKAAIDREHAEKAAKSWLEEINRLKLAAMKHGFDITKEPGS